MSRVFPVHYIGPNESVHPHYLNGEVLEVVTEVNGRLDRENLPADIGAAKFAQYALGRLHFDAKATPVTLELPAASSHGSVLDTGWVLLGGSELEFTSPGQRLDVEVRCNVNDTGGNSPWCEIGLELDGEVVIRSDAQSLDVPRRCLEISGSVFLTRGAHVVRMVGRLQHPTVNSVATTVSFDKRTLMLRERRA